MNNRWVPIHTAHYDLLTSGRLEPKQFVALLRLFDLADYTNGIWNGSSHALAAALGPSYTQRYAKTLLNALEKGGFIKRFRKPAQRGNYDIAIANFMCTAGPHANKFVVLANARCEEDLIYEIRGAKPVKESPVQAAPTVALHPDVEALAPIFEANGKIVHPASRAAMNKFLTEEKYDLGYVTGVLKFAFETDFWSKRILKWEGFEQFYRKGTLGKQYSAWLKKTKAKSTPAPVVATTPAPSTPAEPKPHGRTNFLESFDFGSDDESAGKKPHGRTNFLEAFNLMKDEDLAFSRRAEKMSAAVN